MAALLVLIAVLGIVSALTVAGKSRATLDLVEGHEPTAADVQRLYRALSDADATAASAFLAAGAEPEELRKRYEDDIAVAGPTLGLAAVDRSDPRVAKEIGVIGRQVAVYAGLVETARTHNQQGLPIGGAYLRQASHLMRTQILPAAERLYRIQTERVITERDAATRFPVGPVLLGAVTLIALVAAQFYVYRASRRRLNLGLLTATAAVVIGLAWSAVALPLHAGRAQDGLHSERVSQVSDARITALRARADELLVLVARGNGGAYAEQFTELSQRLVGKNGRGGELREAREAADDSVGGPLDDALTASDAWLKAYREVRKLDDGGQYDEAVKRAIDQQGKDSSAPAFAELDGSIARAIEAERQLFVDGTFGAARALTFLTPGWWVLAVIAAGGVMFGIWQRLREYR